MWMNFFLALVIAKRGKRKWSEEEKKRFHQSTKIYQGKCIVFFQHRCKSRILYRKDFFPLFWPKVEKFENHCDLSSMTIWPSVNLAGTKKDPDALIPGVQTAQSFQTVIGLRNVTGTFFQLFRDFSLLTIEQEWLFRFYKAGQ